MTKIPNTDNRWFVDRKPKTNLEHENLLHMGEMPNTDNNSLQLENPKM